MSRLVAASSIVAMFVSLSVAVALGRRLAQWTIVDLQSEDRTFQALFNEIKAGKFDSIEVGDEIIFFNLTRGNRTPGAAVKR